MGTYGLGCFVHDERPDGIHRSEKAQDIIVDLRTHNRLKALPIERTDKARGTLIAADGTELREYGASGSGTWVVLGELGDGSVRYLGSATHAGHIELKALAVLVDGEWHNIFTGDIEPHLEDERNEEGGRRGSAI